MINPKMNPKTKTALLVAVAVAGFLSIEISLYMCVDRWLALRFYDLSFRDPAPAAFFSRITNLGLAVWYLVPTGISAIVCGLLSRGQDVPRAYRRLCGTVAVRCFFLFSTIALSGIIADIIKPVVARARPILLLHHNDYGFAFFKTQAAWNSMPSGHTTTVFALACCLSELYPRGRILWFAYALTIAFSRIIVDAHYLSDVVAGAFLGWLTVRLFVHYGIIHLWKAIFPVDSPLPLR
jgi:membrane-associated phospholipid phosphatase